MEGDAVFALGVDRAVGPPATVLDRLEDAFVAFRNRQRELEADDSCGCRACRSVGDLDLKIVAHHGRFLRQHFGDVRYVVRDLGESAALEPAFAH